MKKKKNNEEITIFLSNRDILVVDSIKGSKHFGSPHYLCKKGIAKIYIPCGKVDFIRIEPPNDDTPEENSPAP